MTRVSISGEDMKNASPEDLILAYSGMIRKLALSYEKIAANNGAVDRDDLDQEGRLAILEAQKSFDPEKGSSFYSWAIFYIKKRMRTAVGYRSDGTRKEEASLFLDAPVSTEDTETSLIDTIPDESIEENDDRIIRSEQAEEVRAAVARLKCHQQKTIIKQIYFEDMTYKQIAEKGCLTVDRVKQQRNKAIINLRKDWRLKDYVSQYRYRGSVNSFKTSGSSVVEKEVLATEKMYDDRNGEGAYAELIRKARKRWKQYED